MCDVCIEEQVLFDPYFNSQECCSYEEERKDEIMTSERKFVPNIKSCSVSFDSKSLQMLRASLSNRNEDRKETTNHTSDGFL